MIDVVAEVPDVVIRTKERSGATLLLELLDDFDYFFFFYGYGSHRNLHSFPTRRSSDLHHPVRRGGRADRLAAPLLPFPRRGGGARKSTRPNSSHGSSSEAAFCETKK